MKLLFLLVVLIDTVTSHYKHHGYSGPGTYYKGFNYGPPYHATGAPHFDTFHNLGHPGYRGARLGSYHAFGRYPNGNRHSGHYKYNPYVTSGYRGFEPNGYTGYGSDRYLGYGSDIYRDSGSDIYRDRGTDTYYAPGDYTYRRGGPRVHFGPSGFRNSRYPGYITDAYYDLGNGAYNPRDGYSRTEVFENNLSRMQDRTERRRNVRENIVENAQSISQGVAEHRRDMRQSIQDNNRSMRNQLGSSDFRNSRIPGYVNDLANGGPLGLGHSAYDPRAGKSPADVLENNLSRRQDRAERSRNARENIAENTRSIRQDMAKHRGDMRQNIQDNNRSMQENMIENTFAPI